MEKQSITLTVNNDTYTLTIQPHRTLLEVLRDELKLTGTKYGCGEGECGACTVLVNGKPILSCMTMALAVNGQEILTIEGLAKEGPLHPLQKTFIKYGAIQCGFCTPGMLLMGIALLTENPEPREAEIREYIQGNLCRCTGYAKIIEAISAAAKLLGKEE